ncbi:FG-GAP-like repeat-containing protein [Polaribacter glomeratus]|uniref:SbsA Ig-like domain-containing protein n=1 Tax=Polaribacter glomeratus TaxID=102 RepID=A0A2S7WX14_9FLAO|nr:FG-GAP-like repeat-containing protein [Polaribacter glomeratus]PQJ82139.1 hypothetical protein BTO16_05935 [Polaribacter glomeratus]TXD66734.1 T9SS type A sorting domain-containing protein [Polaribacter glomeratus]
MFKHTLILTFLCTLSLQAQFTFDSSSPAAVANSIALDANITLNFSDNTKTASITAANIVITGRYTGSIAGDFSGGGTKTVVFNPTTNFKPGEVITLTLTAAVLNTADEVLTNPTSFSFTSKSALNAFTPSWTDNYVADVPKYSSRQEATTFSIPADIDGDGDIDIISCNFWLYTITLHRNDGNANPSFTSTNIGTTSVATKPYALFAADIDGDGDLDIIEGDSGDGSDSKATIRIYINDNGDGSTWSTRGFTHRRKSVLLEGKPSVFVADMDNDGDMDIIGSGWGNSRIAWYESTDGAGSFSNGEIITNSASAVRSIFAADMDNDGDMDIISASSGDSKIAWYENDGSANPTFTEIGIAGATAAQAIFAADMDNDGDIDIIAVKQNGIKWFENDGSADPTFTAENVATSGPGPNQTGIFGGLGPIAISAADINNDGYMDILSAKSWYLNDGNTNPSWTAATFRNGTDDIRSISAADMDGDGDMDILATSFDDSEISWYKNSTATTWDGSESNAWATADNWSNGVPNTNSDVTIENVGSAPVLTTAASVKSITVNSDASFTESGNSAGLSIATNFTNTGTTTLNSGSSIIVAGNATGEINYKRNIESTNWQFISSPVSGQDIDAFIGAQSMAVGTDDNRGLSDYNNTTEAFTFWQAGTTNSGNFVLGDGRAIKLSETEDITFTGTLSTEKVDIAITSNTNGFNLIGNPYPSYIAANTGADAVNNLLTINDVDNDFLTEATLWFWDQSNESYTTKNLASAAFFIAPGQGFFVSANGDKTFSFTEAMQSHQGTDTFLKTNNNRPEIKISLTNGTVFKHSEIYYIAGTTTSFDNGYDSSIFGGANQNFSLYTHAVANSTGRKLGIQSLPNSDYESMVIPIGIKTAADIEITFSIETLNLPEGLKVYLEDRENNTFTQLDQVNTTYKITLAEAISDIGRFYLHTSQNVLNVLENATLNTISIYKTANTTLRFDGLPQGNTTIKGYNAAGQQVLLTTFVTNGTKDLALPKLAKGVYIIQIETEAGTLSKKIILE